MSAVLDILKASINSRAYQRLECTPQFIAPLNLCFTPKVEKVERWCFGLDPSENSLSYIANVSGLGMNATGIGTSAFKLEAVQKAISEAYERLIYKILKPSMGLASSNGFAAHPSKNLAVANAQAELLERDAILTQWLTREPFLSVDHSVVQDPDLMRAKFKTKAVLISTVGIIPTVTIIKANDEGRAIFATGSGQRFDSSFARAMIEIRRIQKSAEMNLFESSEATAILNSSPPLKQVTHYLLCKNFPSWPVGPKLPDVQIEQYWSKRVKSAPKIAFENRVMAHGSLFVVRSQSASLQELFFGSTELAWQAGKLNSERIKVQKINFENHICA